MCGVLAEPQGWATDASVPREHGILPLQWCRAGIGGGGPGQSVPHLGNRRQRALPLRPLPPDTRVDSGGTGLGGSQAGRQVSASLPPTFQWPDS